MLLTISEKERLSPTLLRVVLRGQKPLPSFRPGQFITVDFRDEEGSFRRSYSIGNPPGGDHWEFYIALVDGGRGSRQLLALEPGAAVRAQPPAGIFTLRPPIKQRMVAVATSTGVVPYRAMQPQMEALLNKGKSISLLYGVRTSENLLFEEEWYDLLKRYNHFEFIPCFSRPRSSRECQRYGAIEGRVQVALKRLPLIGTHNSYFLCGNPNMVDETESMLIGSGVKPDDIFVEAFESL